MANAKQRRQNRLNARDVAKHARHVQSMKDICPNCGQPGWHWLPEPLTLMDILNGESRRGVYLCSKQPKDEPQTGEPPHD